MTQQTPLAPPPNASSPQDNAWSCLVSLETHVQLTQASLTSHTAELTGLNETTKTVSLSLQALLKHLLLAPTPPHGPSVAAARFSSGLSSEVEAPCSNLPYHNAEGKIILPFGIMIPNYFGKQLYMEYIEEWHRLNPGQIVTGKLSSNANPDPEQAAMQ
ncbi:hypothetical protein C0989_002801 [Termitomyces sp. Mn162]|nr:hypothetical protein C0989_002801 [Termitomyces sp. Mn162]